jgi:hypothetical protein
MLPDASGEVMVLRNVQLLLVWQVPAHAWLFGTAVPDPAYACSSADQGLSGAASRCAALAAHYLRRSMCCNDKSLHLRLRNPPTPSGRKTVGRLAGSVGLISSTAPAPPSTFQDKPTTTTITRAAAAAEPAGAVTDMAPSGAGAVRP